MTIVINGRKIAGEIISNLKKKPVSGKFLGTVIVNENDASSQFLRQQSKVAVKLKIPTFICHRPESMCPNSDYLAKEIEFLCESPAVGGINIHLPLPAIYNRDWILEMIDPLKDVNCLNKRNNFVLPPSVMVVEKILKSLKYDLADKKVALIGAGFLVGEPISLYLKNKVKHLTIFRSNHNLRSDFETQVLKEADLVISGVGKAALIKLEMLKSGAGVIDFGVDMVDGKIRGDFDASSLTAIPYTLYPSFYTPTPGGAGPILTACLFENFHHLTVLQK